MNQRAVTAGFLLAIAFPPCAAALQNPPDSALVITNVTVLPMDRERILGNQTVVIERGVITHLGPAARIKTPAGAHIVDGTGKYLIPGIVDVHVHLASNPEDEQRTILKLFVANGVTTVLNLRGTPQILELRSAVAAGRVEQKRAGYDFVKLHGNLSRESYARLNAVARREGIRVIGHAPRNLGAAVMFEERQYAVAHAEEFLYDQNNSSRDATLPQVEASIPGLARSMARARIWLMPNLTAFKTIGWMIQDLDAVLARPEMRYLPSTVRAGWGPGTFAQSLVAETATTGKSSIVIATTRSDC